MNNFLYSNIWIFFLGKLPMSPVKFAPWALVSLHSCVETKKINIP